MMLSRSRLIVFLLGTLSLTHAGLAASAFGQDRITTVQAARYVGQEVTVCGRIASTVYAAGSTGQPTFLNLDRAYPEDFFSIVIWGENRGKFDQPEKTLAEKRICVTGKVESYRDKPQIVAADPSQIALEEDDNQEEATPKDDGLSDREIRQLLMRQSLAGYSGSCPCPYNRDRAGRRCGRRSAYSRPGGASPLCYESDVSDKIVRAYRERQPRRR